MIKSIYFCDVNDCIFIDEHLLFEYYIGKNNTEKVKASDRASKEIECIIDKVNRAYSDNDKQVIYYDRRLVYDSLFGESAVIKITIFDKELLNEIKLIDNKGDEMSLSKYELIDSMIDYDKYELGNKQVKEFGHEYMGNIHMAFVSYTENRDMKNKK